MTLEHRHIFPPINDHSWSQSLLGEHEFVPLKASSRSFSFRGGGVTSYGVPTNENTVPLETWILPALACALLYASYNVAIKRASNDVHPVLGGVVLQTVAATLGLVVWLVLRSSGDVSVSKYNSTGLSWSVAAGVFVGLAEILAFVVNGKGVPVTRSVPIIVGGSVFFGVILGDMFLEEEVSWRGWLGVLLICAGIVIVTIDPGVKP